MAIPHHLQQQLRQALGKDAGEDLVAWMGVIDQHRADGAELRQEVQVGFARVEALIERRVSDLMKWSFVFWVGAVVSIAVLAKVLP